MTIRMQECRDESEIYDYQVPTDLTFEYNKFIKKIDSCGVCLTRLDLNILLLLWFGLARCNIQGSIICTNAYIKDNASLKDCQVGDSHTITEAGEWLIEAI